MCFQMWQIILMVSVAIMWIIFEIILSIAQKYFFHYGREEEVLDTLIVLLQQIITFNISEDSNLSYANHILEKAKQDTEHIEFEG